MKGINAIIGTMLLLSVIVALMGSFFIFSNRSLLSIQTGASNQIETTKNMVSSCILLDGIESKKIYLRNCGNNPISNNSVKVYIDGNSVPISMPNNVSSGSVEEIAINVDLVSGNHDVKVTYSGLVQSTTAYMGTGTSTTTSSAITTTSIASTTVPTTTTSTTTSSSATTSTTVTPTSTTTTIPPTTTTVSSTTTTSVTTTIPSTTTTQSTYYCTPTLCGKPGGSNYHGTCKKTGQYCYCDDACVGNNDCCPDAGTVCGVTGITESNKRCNGDYTTTTISQTTTTRTTTTMTTTTVQPTTTTILSTTTTQQTTTTVTQTTTTTIPSTTTTVPPTTTTTVPPTTTSSTTVSTTSTTTATCLGAGIGNPIVLPSNPFASQVFQISCSAISNSLDCIMAYANGGSSRCVLSSWSGINAIFDCPGLYVGDYTARCAAITGTSSNCCALSMISSYTVASTTTVPQTTTTTLGCRVGPGYTFSSLGSYTASASSGVSSISRSGQYTFYETPHNYINEMNCPWSGTYTCPTGSNMRFYLRAQTETIPGYDFLNIRNSGGTTYEQIDGDYGSIYSWTTAYNQRNAAFNFVSDEDTTNWGIDLYQIDCVTPTSTTTSSSTTTTRLSTTTTGITTTTFMTTTTRVATTTTTISGGECYGADCNPTGDPIGGEAGYSRIIIPTDPRIAYTVTTASQLQSALNSAISGQIIFVPSTASIDLTGYGTLTIKAGVILASDRGYYGSSGGLIYRTDETSSIGTFLIGGNNVRITGLRIQGPHQVYGGNYGDNVRCAIIEENKNGLDVDNCEIYYWSYAAVAFENTVSGTWSGNVHHNYIHHIGGEGYGYGVMVAYGDVLIEANHFDYTRHAVIGEGCLGEKFEYRYNYYGANSLNPVLDCHRDCGGWSAGGVSGRLYLVHHNTIIYGGSVTYNLYGTPSEGAYIYNNRFEQGVQSLNGPTRIYMTNNYVGGTLYSQGPID